MNKLMAGIAATVVLLFAWIGMPSAQTQGRAPAVGSPSADPMEGMIELLKMKGVISAQEAASILEGSPGARTGRDMSAVIELLTQKGVISPEEADQFLARHGRAPSGEVGVALVPASREEEVVREISRKVAREVRQDVQERVKAEIQEEKAKDARLASSSSDWAQRVRFGGDIRLRYQGEFYDKDNAAFLKVGKNGTVSGDLLNTTQDRNRFRIRARLSASARIHETLSANMRISTGNEDDPVSTNETLGDYFNKDGIVLDQAYLHWKPLESLNFWGGRHPSPFFHTDLVWDHDLNFEGVAGSYTHELSDRWKLFATAGAFPLQELEFTERDKWLYGVQVGAEARPDPDVTAKVGVAYYDYVNTVGKANTIQRPDENDHTAPLFVQKGNTLFNIEPQGIRVALASEFRELNVTGQLDIGYWKPVHVILVGDYVRNLGFDKTDVARRTSIRSIPEEVEGYQLGLQVGHPKARSFMAWNAYLYYKHLEADAVMDAFTDSDFHGGGTNAEGWILGAELGLYKNVWLTAKWLTSNEISGPPLAIDIFQFDVNAGF
ncbi:MAG: putative porin [Syntrophobacteraceae bacterium]|jgi:hypothetical protein|nr:putative porin [Syntrophobacteraceae bacterium]